MRAVLRIIATVRLRPAPGGRDADRLELLVSLAARDETARQIEAEGCFGLNGYVGLPGIAEGIDQLLGRDPKLHRPPRLAWGPLVAALAASGIHVGEEELAELPLTIELDEEVAVKLGAPPTLGPRLG